MKHSSLYSHLPMRFFYDEFSYLPYLLYQSGVWGYYWESCCNLGFTIYFTNKGLSSQSYVFPAVMYVCWKLDYKEGWAPKNWCFWTLVLEKTLESRLDSKEIQPVHPKGNQSWIFIGRTEAEGETPIFWPPDVKNWLIEKDPDAGKDLQWEEKGATEDEMVGWNHNSMDMSLSKFQELVMDREDWRAAVHGVTKSQVLLRDWSELNWIWKNHNHW